MNFYTFFDKAFKPYVLTADCVNWFELLFIGLLLLFLIQCNFFLWTS